MGSTIEKEIKSVGSGHNLLKLCLTSVITYLHNGHASFDDEKSFKLELF